MESGGLCRSECGASKRKDSGKTLSSSKPACSFQGSPSFAHASRQCSVYPSRQSSPRAGTCLSTSACPHPAWGLENICQTDMTNSTPTHSLSICLSCIFRSRSRRLAPTLLPAECLSWRLLEECVPKALKYAHLSSSGFTCRNTQR